MKVYFTASTTHNGVHTALYKKILLLLKQHRLTIVSGDQIVNPAKLASDARLSSQDIFSRETRLIDEADCVIAEVSQPSHGVGGEIVYALTRSKPVLALINTQFEDAISPMLKGNPSENLFLEYYSDENLKFILTDFVSYQKKVRRRKGKLIVIDGGNGSGKTTQAELLVASLKKRKIPVKYMDFPQYYHSFHGKTVAQYLRGEFGSIDQTSPYLISLAFALDRASVKKEMEEFLGKGGYIIANRYATSNMAHQAAKFKTEEERKKYLKWVYELEYKVHKIPKEDLVIYLYVPWQVGQELTKKKGDRSYLKGQAQDIEEKDLNNRMTAEEMYLSLAKKYRHWQVVDCMRNGSLMSKESIHGKVLALVSALTD